MTGAVSSTLQLIAGRELELLAAAGIVPPRRGHMRCPFPSHPDRNASWRWDTRQAGWHCTCGSGDALDALQAMGFAHDHLSAAQAARDILGLDPLGRRREETPQQRAERERRNAEALARAQELQRQREAEAVEYARQQRVKAFKMWMRRRSDEGTVVEAYLRARGYSGAIPRTIGYLPPARPDHHPAMISAFGVPDEPEPGALLLPPARLRGVHLTLLRPDGSGKAEVEHAKITVGRDHDAPIVLAPPGDGLGLVIAEGIEDALSAHQQTGLGAWAAGTANRLPGLARHVPTYIEAVTIMVDADPAGRTFSERLAALLRDRAEVRMIEAPQRGRRDAHHGT